MMVFGLSTACLYPQETEKTIEYYCQNGVKACEIFFNTFSELNVHYVKELRRMCDASGLRAISAHPFTSGFEPFMMFTDYPRRFEDFLEMYRQYFEACGLLGSTILVFHGDRRESLCPNPRYFERYHRLYELGRSYGVFVAQENVVRCRSHSAQFIGEMRSALGEDVRFVLDTKQAVRAGQDLFEMVDAMGERLLHVHLSDHSERGDCLPVGSGTLDIKRLLNALKTVGFDENVIMELYRENFDEPEELMVSLKTLEYFSETYK